MDSERSRTEGWTEKADIPPPRLAPQERGHGAGDLAVGARTWGTDQEIRHLGHQPRSMLMPVFQR